jgi:methyltransferase-like protein
MAVALPNSTFVGIDLSQRQIDEGLEMIERLELSNIELRHKSITAFDTESEFDYIICHGVYSWVTREVQDAIMKICARHMAPNGVAYISYNTYPGWFMRGMVRQMMCFHARQFDETQQQVDQARALLDFLIEAAPSNSDSLYKGLLDHELQIIRNRADSYLYHEHLEETNEPLFFYQFVERAGENELQYPSEVDFSSMLPGDLTAEAQTTLDKISSNIVHTEQYMDFLRNRMFRRTLLCHSSVNLERSLGPDQIHDLYVSTDLRRESESSSPNSYAPEKFTTPSGTTATISNPLLKAALSILEDTSPQAEKVSGLLSQAYEVTSDMLVRDSKNIQQDAEMIARLLLELYSRALVEFRVTPQPYVSVAGDLPQATPLARWQAENISYVTTMRHTTEQLGDLERRLIVLLNGKNKLSDIQKGMRKLVLDGDVVVEHKGQRMTEETLTDDIVRKIVDRGLRQLCGKALLVA